MKNFASYTFMPVTFKKQKSLNYRLVYATTSKINNIPLNEISFGMGTILNPFMEQIKLQMIARLFILNN